jgi:hypothetical protein
MFVCIRFVSQGKSIPNSNEGDKESNEPDYDEHEGQPEEEEEEDGKVTINQVF